MHDMQENILRYACKTMYNSCDSFADFYSSLESSKAENKRLLEAEKGSQPWKLWGPYLSERQWATVREDESTDGSWLGIVLSLNIVRHFLEFAYQLLIVLGS